MTAHRRPLDRTLLAVAAFALIVSACTGAAAPAVASPSAPTPSATPSPSADPGGGGSDRSVGSGGAVIVDPGQPTPVDPAAGQPTLVVPKAGQRNPHPVAPITLETSVDGRHVLVKVSWWSGVAPCNVLDSVRVDRSGTDIAITVIEGSSNLDAICIEIAQLKATIVDLGDLEPGTYTITAPNSEARPVQVTVT